MLHVQKSLFSVFCCPACCQLGRRGRPTYGANCIQYTQRKYGCNSFFTEFFAVDAVRHSTSSGAVRPKICSFSCGAGKLATGLGTFLAQEVVCFYCACVVKKSGGQLMVAGIERRFWPTQFRGRVLTGESTGRVNGELHEQRRCTHILP